MSKSENMKTAITLTHAAALLQIIFTIIAFIAVFGLMVFVPRGGLLAGIAGIIGIIIDVIWAWADYEIIYEQMRKGKYASISSSMLVIGILQLFIGGTIPGIIIIIAWFVARS